MKNLCNEKISVPCHRAEFCEEASSGEAAHEPVVVCLIDHVMFIENGHGLLLAFFSMGVIACDAVQGIVGDNNIQRMKYSASLEKSNVQIVIGKETIFEVINAMFRKKLPAIPY